MECMLCTRMRVAAVSARSVFGVRSHLVGCCVLLGLGLLPAIASALERVTARQALARASRFRPRGAHEKRANSIAPSLVTTRRESREPSIEADLGLSLSMPAGGGLASLFSALAMRLDLGASLWSGNASYWRGRRRQETASGDVLFDGKSSAVFAGFTAGWSRVCDWERGYTSLVSLWRNRRLGGGQAGAKGFLFVGVGAVDEQRDRSTNQLQRADRGNYVEAGVPIPITSSLLAGATALGLLTPEQAVTASFVVPEAWMTVSGAVYFKSQRMRNMVERMVAGAPAGPTGDNAGPWRPPSASWLPDIDVLTAGRDAAGAMRELGRALASGAGRLSQALQTPLFSPTLRQASGSLTQRGYVALVGPKYPELFQTGAARSPKESKPN